MVSGINSNGAMQQMQHKGINREDGMEKGQGHHGQGQGMGQLMQALPDDFRQNLSDTLHSIDDKSQKKDIVSQLKELDVENLSQEDLINQINNILNPQSTDSTATDSIFSTYA